jgi:hypothetical protein
MSSKKKSSNGALEAPVPTVFDGLPLPKEAEGVPIKKSNGKTRKVKTDTEDYESLDSRELLRVLSEVKNGNFSTRMSVDKIGISGKIVIR